MNDSTHNDIDRVALTPDPIPAAEVIASVTDAAAGGVAVFLGTTRNATSADGRPLLALHYEAYDDMAPKQLLDLARRARARWPIVKLAILHRTGQVGLGEPSVVIAVSTPHRGEAFDACRWIIDTLKVELTVWKQEIWADGAATWVHPEAG